jgi:uncharacterized protein YegL
METLWPKAAKTKRQKQQRRLIVEQVPFGTSDFAENPEPRVPCVLILDVSYSMRGDPINELNEGLTAYREELAADSLASKRVEIALVTFGGVVSTVQDFATAEHFHPPALVASGDTPLGEAVSRGISMLDERKKLYKANGIMYYRPWLFLITDGGPTDSWQGVAKQALEGDKSKAFSFFSVGVGESANFDVLANFSARAPLKLKGLRFRDLFLWLSSSQQSVSKSSPGDAVPLANPATPDGWAEV